MLAQNWLRARQTNKPTKWKHYLIGEGSLHWCSQDWGGPGVKERK